MSPETLRSAARRATTVVFLAALACAGGDSITRYGVTPDESASAYRVRSLVGALSGTSSIAHDVNDFGDVVGVSDRRPVRWVVDQAAGAFGPFPLLLPDESDPGRGAAMSISERGLIVGSLEGPPVRPFVWIEGRGIRELPLPPGLNAGVAYDVNDKGQVVGSGSEDPDFARPEEGRVLLWQVSIARDTVTVEDLGTFDGIGARGHAISTEGQIVGVVWLPDGGGRATFMWSEAAGFDGLPLGTEGLGVNDVGDVVGGWSDRAAIWSGGSVEAIGPLGSLAHDVSNFGHVVGEIAGAGPDERRSAFLLRDGTLTVLEGLSSLDEGRARAVNDLGVIVGENFVTGGTGPEAVYWVPRR